MIEFCVLDYVLDCKWIQCFRLVINLEMIIVD